MSLLNNKHHDEESSAVEGVIKARFHKTTMMQGTSDVASIFVVRHELVFRLRAVDSLQ